MKFGLVSLRADAQGSPGRRIVSARKTSQTGPESCAVRIRDGISGLPINHGGLQLTIRRRQSIQISAIMMTSAPRWFLLSPDNRAPWTNYSLATFGIG